jgi:rRNA maturation endonuclease Nob1
MEAEYICLNCGQTLSESELNECEICGHKTCPRIMTSSELCGGEVQAIQEYNEAMKINAREEK